MRLRDRPRASRARRGAAPLGRRRAPRLSSACFARRPLRLPSRHASLLPRARLLRRRRPDTQAVSRSGLRRSPRVRSRPVEHALVARLAQHLDRAQPARHARRARSRSPPHRAYRGAPGLPAARPRRARGARDSGRAAGRRRRPRCGRARGARGCGRGRAGAGSGAEAQHLDARGGGEVSERTDLRPGEEAAISVVAPRTPRASWATRASALSRRRASSALGLGVARAASACRRASASVAWPPPRRRARRRRRRRAPLEIGAHPIELGVHPIQLRDPIREPRASCRSGARGRQTTVQPRGRRGEQDGEDAEEQREAARRAGGGGDGGTGTGPPFTTAAA